MGLGSTVAIGGLAPLPQATPSTATASRAKVIRNIADRISRPMLFVNSPRQCKFSRPPVGVHCLK